jgi:hypothetical protein
LFFEGEPSGVGAYELLQVFLDKSLIQGEEGAFLAVESYLDITILKLSKKEIGRELTRENS